MVTPFRLLTLSLSPNPGIVLQEVEETFNSLPDLPDLSNPGRVLQEVEESLDSLSVTSLTSPTLQ